MPVYQLLDDYIGFPDPDEAEEDGLLAVGGDLSPERVLYALSIGIFPWPIDDSELLWWSLNPRFILFPEKAHISHSLRRSCKKFTVKINHNFLAIISKCANVQRKDQDSTWITDGIIECYTKLHELGYAYSFEAYCGDNLAGGLYGVWLGDVFIGESMFHEVTDAGKVAFCGLIHFCLNNNIKLIDCQQETALLGSLGAESIPRKEYIRLLEENIKL